jgi:hypothetical protein
MSTNVLSIAIFGQIFVHAHDIVVGLSYALQPTGSDGPKDRMRRSHLNLGAAR